jgi:hypothetical protein
MVGGQAASNDARRRAQRHRGDHGVAGASDVGDLVAEIGIWTVGRWRSKTAAAAAG